MKIVEHSDVAPTPVSHDPAISKRVILKSGEVEHITQASETTLMPGQGTTEHTHKDMAEIYTIPEGALDFVVDGRLSAVRGPVTVVIHPGEAHTVRNTSGKPVTMSYVGVLSREQMND